MQYDSDIGTVTSSLVNSTISATTQTTVLAMLNTLGTNVQVTNVGTVSSPSGLTGASVATVTGDVNLNGATAEEVGSLALLVVTNTANVEINSDNFGGTVVLGGEAGGGTSNVAINSTQNVTVELGAGDASVNIGDGGSTVVVGGGNATVTSGSGNDEVVITANFNGTAVLDGGTGTNRMALNNVTSVVSTTSPTSSTSTTSTTAGLEIGTDGNATASTTSTSTTPAEAFSITLKNGSTVVATNFNQIDLGDDDVNVNVSSSKLALNLVTGIGNDVVKLGKGADLLTLSGGDDKISMGSGDDTVVIKSGFTGNAVVVGGWGKNALNIGDVGTITSDGKTGSWIAEMDNAGSSVTFKNFQSIVLGNDSVDIDTSAWNSALNLTTGTSADSILLGAGRDSVTLTGGNDTVNTGAGNDKLKITDGFIGTAIVDGGAGKNELSLSGGNEVIADSNGKLVVTMDNGATVDATNFMALVLGDGTVSVDTSASTAKMSLIAGTGDDSVRLGSGNDSITLSGGNDTINTGAGNDRLVIDKDFTGAATVDGAEGVDKLDLRAVTIQSVSQSGTTVKVTLENGAMLDVKNVESFVYDSNGEATGGITAVGIATLDSTF